ncbi:unnamed protein product [Ectocarpus sp. 12 AP-2014]
MMPLKCPPYAVTCAFGEGVRVGGDQVSADERCLRISHVVWGRKTGQVLGAAGRGGAARENASLMRFDQAGACLEHDVENKVREARHALLFFRFQGSWNAKGDEAVDSSGGGREHHASQHRLGFLKPFGYIFRRSSRT